MSTPTVSKKNLEKIRTALNERYSPYIHRSSDEFIECMMYQILALGTTPDAAQQALSAMHDEFVDWNDMRMASVREIQDVLGESYARCREKAEDVINLLADLYTAFHRMNIGPMIPTDDGVMTIRALPKTTLIRRDMVEEALIEVYEIPGFPCDLDQFALLQFLGGINKKLTYDEGMELITVALIEGKVSAETLRSLGHGLRSHCDFLAQSNIFTPKAIGYGWDKPDPLGMKVSALKSLVVPVEPIAAILPKPKPTAEELAAITAANASKAAAKQKSAATVAATTAASTPAKQAPVKSDVHGVALAEDEEDFDDLDDESNDTDSNTNSDAENATDEAAAISKEDTQSPAAPAKKAVVKKVAAKKAATKKAATKKTVAKKAAPKKIAAKKSVVKKIAAKKTVLKKVAAKKSIAKKSAVKKGAIKKNGVKKIAARKSTKASAKKKK